MQIHKTVIIEKETTIDPSVSIDAYSVIRRGCIIDSGTIIGTGVEIAPYTRVGKNNLIFKGSYLGACPQHKDHLPCNISDTMLKIGNENVIREYVNIHHGMIGATVIKHNNYFMAHSHIGHDCLVHNHTTLANYAGLGGHVELGDYAFVSGHSLIHQHTRVGRLAMIGGLCAINQDVPPYSLVASNYGKLTGLNITGIKRNTSLNNEDRVSLNKLFKLIFRSGYNLKETILKIEEMKEQFVNIEYEAKEIIAFMKNTKRGVIRKWRKEA